MSVRKKKVTEVCVEESLQETVTVIAQSSEDTILQSEDVDDGTSQFVTFAVGSEVFAVPIAEVQEIVRVPGVTHVPLSPDNLEGLANLRGTTLPIVSLRSVFNCPEKENDDSTRVLVINHGILLGFIVDEVSSVVSVENSQIEGVESIECAVNAGFLSGVIKNIGGHQMVMVLDFENVLKSQFSVLEDSIRSKVNNSVSDSHLESQETDDNSDQLHLVSFAVDGQEYAIAIEQVQEIVQVPEQIIQVPNSAPQVLGVMTLRNNLLPLVSLRHMFSLKVEPLNEHNRIVVINLSQGTDRRAGTSVGIVTDTVNEVLRVDRSIVDELPAVLAADHAMVDISAIGRLDGGKRLVSFISAETMFNSKAVKDAIKMVDSQEVDIAMDDQFLEQQDDAGNDDEEQVVIFSLGGEEFGVPINTVNEIVRVPETLIKVPKAPAFVEGVINLRGAVLPVIDQRRRFGLEAIERNDRQRIVVFSIGGTMTGFIVDSVSQVFKIPKESIEVAPSLSEEQANVIRNVANIGNQGRMILLLDVTHLLDIKETNKLASMAA